MRLTIDSIYYTKNGTSILSGVFLATRTGEVMGILGRNGSGKSTLFEIIFGAIKSTFGVIRIDGIRRTNGYHKGMIQLLPQSGFLHKQMSMNQALKIFKQEWSESDFIELGLNSLRGKKVNELSLGQKKIFECGLLMRTASQVVLLDEPFSGIGPIHIEMIKRLIRQNAPGKCILVTDHKYQDIMEISDQLAIISSGQTKIIEKSVESLKLNGYLNELSLKAST